MSRNRPAVVGWIVDLLEVRHSFDHRAATLHCLGCYLYENTEAQLSLVSKLSQ
eukprot:Pgem_evm1s3762